MVKVNEIYTVTHVRKGTFVVGITHVGNDYAEGYILDGRAHYTSGENNILGRGYTGDGITLPFKFCTFEPWLT